MRPSSVVVQYRGIVFRCVGRGGEAAQWVRWRRRTTGEQQSGAAWRRVRAIKFLRFSGYRTTKCARHTHMYNMCAGSTDAKTADYHIYIIIIIIEWFRESHLWRQRTLLFYREKNNNVRFVFSFFSLSHRVYNKTILLYTVIILSVETICLILQYSSTKSAIRTKSNTVTTGYRHA